MITVAPITAAEKATALAILFQHLSPAERTEKIEEMLEAISSGTISLDDVWLAKHDDGPAGVLLTVKHPGRTVSLWPPVVKSKSHDPTVSDALLCAVAAAFDDDDICLAQALIEPEDEAGSDALNRNGFRYLTDLDFLQKSFDEPLLQLSEPPLEFVTYGHETHERFLSMLEKTYRQTQDCPELNGLRTAEETLSGHKISGDFHPQYWRLFHTGDRDVGVVLLSEHPKERSWELVYMGVSPQERGARLGQRMLIDSLIDLKKRGAWSVFLAVDSRNVYAKKTYEQLGFCVFAIRALHLRVRPRGN